MLAALRPGHRLRVGREQDLRALSGGGWEEAAGRHMLSAPLRSAPSPRGRGGRWEKAAGRWCKRGVGKGPGHQVHPTVAQSSEPERPG